MIDAAHCGLFQKSYLAFFDDFQQFRFQHIHFRIFGRHFRSNATEKSQPTPTYRSRTHEIRWSHAARTEASLGHSCSWAVAGVMLLTFIQLPLIIWSPWIKVLWFRWSILADRCWPSQRKTTILSNHGIRMYICIYFSTRPRLTTLQPFERDDDTYCSKRTVQSGDLKRQFFFFIHHDTHSQNEKVRKRIGDLFVTIRVLHEWIWFEEKCCWTLDSI